MDKRKSAMCIFGALCTAVALTMTACDDADELRSPNTGGSEELDVDRAPLTDTNALDRTGDDLERGAEDAGEALKEGTRDLGESVGRGLERTGEEIKDAAK